MTSSTGSRSLLPWATRVRVAKGQAGVRRPLKRSEYTIQFATRQAEKGWTDLLGTTRNAVVEA